MKLHTPPLPEISLPEPALIAALLALLLLPLSGCTRAESDAAPARAQSSDLQTPSPTERGEPTTPRERLVSVEVIELVPSSVVDRASLSAELLPLRRAVLAAEVPGTVDALHVREGRRVQVGTPLLEVDTRALAQRLAAAEAVHRQRQIQFDRAEKLLAKRSITQVQMLDAVTARDVAVSQLERARLELEKSKIVAPWSGTVSVRHVEAGDYVQPGAPVLELVDTSRLEVRAPAPASDVPYLRVGAEAEIRVDVFPGEVFTGRIVRLGTELDAGARTLDVTAEIENPRGRLRPGLSARLDFARWDRADALLVPLDAVVELMDRHVVYVVEATDGADELRSVQRPVRLGPVIGQSGVLIEGGLEAGERVVVGGQRRVSPGQKVRVSGARAPAGAP